VTSYQDLDAPVQGFRMQVRRTYDSFDKTRVTSASAGEQPPQFPDQREPHPRAGGWIQYNTQWLLRLCLTAFRNLAPRYVTIVFPDQHAEIFDASGDGGRTSSSALAVFTARPGTGTTSKLAAAGRHRHDSEGSRRRALTTTATAISTTGAAASTTPSASCSHGRRYEAASGPDPRPHRHARPARQPAVCVRCRGDVFRGGPSIAFTRDGAGRITQSVARRPERSLHVFRGRDLASVTDLNTNLTTFAYDSSHDLQSATGRRAAADRAI